MYATISISKVKWLWSTTVKITWS